MYSLDCVVLEEYVRYERMKALCREELRRLPKSEPVQRQRYKTQLRGLQRTQRHIRSALSPAGRRELVRRIKEIFAV